eukprot:2878281-Amphidinium_carterae.3
MIASTITVGFGNRVSESKVVGTNPTLSDLRQRGGVAAATAAADGILLLVSPPARTSSCKAGIVDEDEAANAFIARSGSRSSTSFKSLGDPGATVLFPSS